MCVARPTTNDPQQRHTPPHTSIHPNTDKLNMMIHNTLNQLRGLRLETMAQALEQQLAQSGMAAMSFEERLALLVDREVHGRQDRR